MVLLELYSREDIQAICSNVYVVSSNYVTIKEKKLIVFSVLHVLFYEYLKKFKKN